MASQQVTPQDRAERSAQAMWKNDNVSRLLNMRLDSVGPGRAVMSMTVQAMHTNGHDTCHGGISYTLADTALAYACNSYNQVTVAQQNSITYLSPAHVGDNLTATAIERSKTERSGLYDVRITRDDGSVIAEFRGGSRTVRGQHFDEGPK